MSFLSIRKVLLVLVVKDSCSQEFWSEVVQNHCKLRSLVLVSTLVTIRWDVLANEPKRHVAQLKTMKKQEP